MHQGVYPAVACWDIRRRLSVAIYAVFCTRCVYFIAGNQQAYLGMVEILLRCNTITTSQELQKTMAHRRKRTRSKKSTGSTLAKYTVVVCQGEYIECDTCCMISDTMYEFEDGSCVCDTCLHGLSTFDYLMAGIYTAGGIYGYDGGEFW